MRLKCSPKPVLAFLNQEEKLSVNGGKVLMVVLVNCFYDALEGNCIVRKLTNLCVTLPFAFNSKSLT